MPVSNRHVAAARRQKAPGPTSNKYEVVDEGHQGNELGGINVFLENGKKYVVLLPVQAQYWLDQGVIVPFEPEPEPEQPQKVRRG